jgi:hypothetical protein
VSLELNALPSRLAARAETSLRGTITQFVRNGGGVTSCRFDYFGIFGNLRYLFKSRYPPLIYKQMRLALMSFRKLLKLPSPACLPP